MYSQFTVIIILMLFSYSNQVIAQDNQKEQNRDSLLSVIYNYIEQGRLKGTFNNPTDMEMARFPFYNGSVNIILMLEDARFFVDISNDNYSVLVTDFLLSSHIKNYLEFSEEEEINYKKLKKELSQIKKHGIISSVTLNAFNDESYKCIYELKLSLDDNQISFLITLTNEKDEIGIGYLSFDSFEIVSP